MNARGSRPTECIAIAMFVASLSACAGPESPATPDPPDGQTVTDSAATDTSTGVDSAANEGGAVDAGADVGEAEVALSDASAVEISTGYDDNCGRTLGGRVRCWGRNYFGAVGDGTKGAVLAPGTAVPLLSEVTQVAVGGAQACALHVDGTVSCWGHGIRGLLGDGVLPGPEIALPTKVPGLVDVRQVGVGGAHRCALMADRTVRCWGYNILGQLGYPTTTLCGGEDATGTCSATPSAVPGLEDVAQIAFGEEHTCALTQSSRHVYCWGSNTHGALGDGTKTSRWQVRPVPGVENVIEIRAALNSTCARRADGTVLCWGLVMAPYVTLDGGSPGSVDAIEVKGFSSKVRAIGLGSRHGCAIVEGGAVECWGQNQDGALGLGVALAKIPQPVADAFGAEQLSLNQSRSCAVFPTGALKCWGIIVGDGTAERRDSPVSVLW